MYFFHRRGLYVGYLCNWPISILSRYYSNLKSGKLVACSTSKSSKSNFLPTVRPHSSTTSRASLSKGLVRWRFVRSFHVGLSLSDVIEISWVSRYFPRAKGAGKHKLWRTKIETMDQANRFLSTSVWTCILLLLPPDGMTVREIWIPKLLSILNLFWEFKSSTSAWGHPRKNRKVFAWSGNWQSKIHTPQCNVNSVAGVEWLRNNSKKPSPISLVMDAQVA